MTRVGQGWRIRWITLGLILAAVFLPAFLLVWGGSGTRTPGLRVPVEPVVLRAVSQWGGTVAEVCTKPGEAVRQEQVLVRLDANGLRRQRSALVSALEVLRSGLRPARLPEGARGVLLDAHPLVVRAEEGYVTALRAFEQQPGDSKLHRALDQAETARVQARRRVAGLLGNGAKLTATVALIESRLKDLDRALAGTEVRAPADAVVDVLDLRRGDRILPGQPIATLLQRRQYFSEFAVQWPEAARLQPGAVGRGSLAPSGETFKWRVESITRRPIPPVLRDSTGRAEEWLVRVRFAADSPWKTGVEADLQTP